MSISCKGSKISEQTVRKNKKIIHEETHFTINKSFRNIDKKKESPRMDSLFNAFRA